MGREGGREWRVVISLGSAVRDRGREGFKGSFVSFGWADGEGGREGVEGSYIPITHSKYIQYIFILYFPF